jgi:hypothetical protein
VLFNSNRALAVNINLILLFIPFEVKHEIIENINFSVERLSSASGFLLLINSSNLSYLAMATINRIIDNLAKTISNIPSPTYLLLDF